MRYSKAVQLSSVLALSVVVSGSFIANVRAAVGFQSLRGNMQQLAQQSGEPDYTSNPYWQIYLESEYNSIDAQLLADFWDESLLDAKFRIGRKLSGTAEDAEVLESTLLLARSQEQAALDNRILSPAETQDQDWAAFFDSDFTYDDAVLLSEFWGESLGDTKAHMGRELRTREERAEQLMTELLADVRAGTAVNLAEVDAAEEPSINDGSSVQGPIDFTDPYWQNWSMFFETDYSYDDAVLLSGFWGISVDDTKARIGDMLSGTGGADNVVVIDELLRKAKEAADPDRDE